MAATYSLSTNIGKVRLHINDTDITTPKLTDEEIQYALDEKTSVGGAVVWCLEFLRAKVADPNFTADWLTVDNASAFKSYTALLASKRAEFGISALTVRTVYTYRPDSGQTEAPTFTDDFDDDDEDDD